MVAVPAATPLTSPEEDMVAQPLGDEFITLHVTDLFVASSGVIVAVKDDELPTITSSSSGIETPVTATGAAAPTVSVKELRKKRCLPDGHEIVNEVDAVVSLEKSYVRFPVATVLTKDVLLPFVLIVTSVESVPKIATLATTFEISISEKANMICPLDEEPNLILVWFTPKKPDPVALEREMTPASQSKSEVERDPATFVFSFAYDELTVMMPSC